MRTNINYLKKLLRVNIEKSNFLPFLLIILFTLNPLLWYKRGYIISGADLHYSLNVVNELRQRTSVWNNVFLIGTDRSMDMTIIPFTLIMNIINLLPIPLDLAEILFFMSLSFLIVFSIYLLSKRLFENKLIVFIVMFFYVYSFYQFYNFEIVRFGEIAATILLPILLLLSYNILINGHLTKKDYYILIFFFFITGPIGIQPPVLLIDFGFMFIFSLFIIIFKKIDYKKLINILMLVILFIIFNLYWILPVYFYTSEANYFSSNKAISVFSVIDLLKWTSAYSSFFSLFRFLARTVWFSDWKHQPYFPTIINLNNNLISIIGVLFYVFVISIFFFNKKKIKYYNEILFFLIINFLSMFLSKGIHRPFSSIYLWLINNLPGFWIYRAPYEKFGLLQLISFSLLMGYVVREYKLLLKKKIFVYLITFLIILNLLFNIPFIKGDMIPSSDGDYGYHQYFNVGFYQKFPNYLYNSSNYINNQSKEFNILLMPAKRSNIYYWGYGSATDISFYLFNKGLLFKQYGEGTAPPSPVDYYYNLIQDDIYNEKTNNVYKLLNKLNIKYILQRNDFRYDFYSIIKSGLGDFNESSPEFIKNRLNYQSNIIKNKTFGSWDFYKVNIDSSIIYQTNNLIQINDSNDINNLLLYCNNFTTQDFYYSSNNSNLLNYTSLRLISYKDNFKITFNESLKDYNVKHNSLNNSAFLINNSLVINAHNVSDFFINKHVSNQNITLSFDYKIINFTNNSLLKIWCENQNKNETVLLKDSNNWENINITFLDFNSTYIKIHLIFRNISIKIDNITLNNVFSYKCIPTNITINNYSSKLHFIKDNPSKYEIFLENPQRNYILVFSQLFNSKWLLFAEPLNISEPRYYDLTDLRFLFKKPLLSEHFLINGFANAWNINSDYVCDYLKLPKNCNYKLIIIFKSQLYFYLGIIIGLMVLLIILLLINKNYLKRNK